MPNPSPLVSNRHGLAGQDLEMTVHIKYGRDPGKLLRVYYAIPKGEEVLAVGHCGDQAAQDDESD